MPRVVQDWMPITTAHPAAERAQRANGLAQIDAGPNPVQIFGGAAGAGLRDGAVIVGNELTGGNVPWLSPAPAGARTG